MALTGKKPVLRGAPQSRPVEPSDEAIERVMSRAPDYRPPEPPEASEPPARSKRKRKKPTTLTMDAEMIDALDDLARSRGMSRASVMILACSEHLARSKKDAS